MYEEQYHVQANRLMKILDGNKYEFNKLKKRTTTVFRCNIYFPE